MDLVYGKVAGFEIYKVDKPITYDYDIKSTDFPITDGLYVGVQDSMPSG